MIKVVSYVFLSFIMLIFHTSYNVIVTISFFIYHLRNQYLNFPVLPPLISYDRPWHNILVIVTLCISQEVVWLSLLVPNNKQNGQRWFKLPEDWGALCHAVLYPNAQRSCSNASILFGEISICSWWSWNGYRRTCHRTEGNYTTNFVSLDPTWVDCLPVSCFYNKTSILRYKDIHRILKVPCRRTT